MSAAGPPLVNAVLERTAPLQFDRQNRCAAVMTLVRGVFTRPRLVLRGATWLFNRLWRARTDLLRSRGRVDKLSFFIHSFMDACSLDKERMVPTPQAIDLGRKIAKGRLRRTLAGFHRARR